ncbi:putative flagellar associated protein [Paratrimastix pyriformis]|uniref:Flagellar associated protein n=1 Tax=Paratrimastix pyriformis TaxID=342808 RepID=A0ABQ8USZ6_9EUKA|nr:putative flagellar associated protein [Paratrimastix pyriformis]
METGAATEDTADPQQPAQDVADQQQGFQSQTEMAESPGEQPAADQQTPADQGTDFPLEDDGDPTQQEQQEQQQQEHQPERVSVQYYRDPAVAAPPAPGSFGPEGGFVNRKTGTAYRNSGLQTDPKPRPPWVCKYHRSAQTTELVSHTQQTTREQGTQMPKPGLFVDGAEDKVLTARPYFTSRQWDELLIRTAVLLQRVTRGWIARKRAQELRKERDLKVELIRKREEERAAAAEKQRIREMARRMHPRTKADIDILYAELEAWRQQETTRINALGLPEEERLAALAVVLNNETRMLQTIDRLKLVAAQENREQRIRKTIELVRPRPALPPTAQSEWPSRNGPVGMAQSEWPSRNGPVGMAQSEWPSRNGPVPQLNFFAVAPLTTPAPPLADSSVVSVHTPFTTRARELGDLYAAMRLPLLTVDERLDVLLHVKWTEFDCSLTRELVDLIDREADLLNRGRSDGSLEGLRKRSCNLFLQFIETPEFNPEAARFQKVRLAIPIPSPHLTLRGSPCGRSVGTQVPRELMARPNTRPLGASPAEPPGGIPAGASRLHSRGTEASSTMQSGPQTQSLPIPEPDAPQEEHA